MELHERRKCKCVEHTGGEAWHDKASGYTYHRCHCDGCRTAIRRHLNEWGAANPEKRRKHFKAWKASHPDVREQGERRYYEENRTARKEAARRWRDENPVAARAIRDRHRKKGAA